MNTIMDSPDADVLEEITTYEPWPGFLTVILAVL